VPPASRHDAIPREAPRASTPAHIDDDLGNRMPREANRPRSSGNEAPRAERPPEVDDDFGNR
jgi:hypothetical protein